MAKEINKKDLRSIISFGIIGCINTGVDFLVYTILRKAFGIDFLICQAAGYFSGMINSFIMNKIFTFQNKSAKTETSVQFGKFAVINGISFCVSLISMKVFIKGLGINEYISKVLVTLIIQVINYFGYRLWVFNNILEG